MTKPDITVLYEDNHLLGVVKPVNVPTQADESQDPDLLSMLKEDLKIRYNKPGNVYVGLVHRLDRQVGGAMIFAKTSKAASRLSDAVRTRSLRKEYAAIVHGKLPAPQGTLRDYLLKDSRTNMVAVARPGTPGAKEAILDYEVLAGSGTLSLVRVKLHTGRSHQIRVQMSHAGCPLYGDQKYGAHLNKPGQQIALWSILVGLQHPVTKEEIVLQSTPPQAAPWEQFDLTALL